MLRVASAVLGAISFQLMQFALEPAQSRAAWGWSLDVPADLGFTCEEGTSIGGTDFDCTVVPDAGMGCDVSSTSVVCYKIDTPETIFVPTQGQCLTVGHMPGTDENDNDSALTWSTVPTCTQAGQASGAPMASAVGAAILVGLLCV